MEEIDDETDLQEQIFHNNVREQIVSELCFISYQLVSIVIINELLFLICKDRQVNLVI